jgi:hypothetical protein
MSDEQEAWALVEEISSLIERAEAAEKGWHEAEQAFTDAEALVAERDEALADLTVFATCLKHSEARVTELEAALRRGCDETDYCYVCDCHPSHGHAKDCALAAPTKEEG